MKRYLLICLLILTLILLFSCDKDEPDPIVTESETESETVETTISPITDIEVIQNETVTEETTTESPAETTTIPEETTKAETTTEPPPKVIDKYINPLTGLKSTVEMASKRPVSIMINNLKQSLPQEGISNADVMYECLVEGGTTRLMMLVTNYEALGTIGSVRSARDYYIDLAQNHDAIFIHAGGSPLAYDNIQGRRINNLDGVNMYVPSMFYRDAERRKTMAMEHTLMTSGTGIVSGIDYTKYRTTIKDDFTSPFNFVDYGTERKLTGNNFARHLIIPYNSAQFPQYIYQPNTNTYLRYQYNGIAHIDGVTNTQLEFTNVILLVCEHGDLNDAKGRIGIHMTGTGTAYYVYGGKYEKLKWSKDTRDSQIVLTNLDGTPLIMNCGKTAVNVISPSVEEYLTFNYSANR